MHSAIIISATIGAIATAPSVSASGYYGSDQSGSCYASPGPIINVQFPLTTDYYPYTQSGSANYTDISNRAHGTGSNAPPPKTVSQNTLTSLQIAVQFHIYAVAYILQLLAYITNGKPGFYVSDSKEQEYVIAALMSQMAQEELQGILGESLLSRLGGGPLIPCKYYWPASSKDYNSAVNNLALQFEAYCGFAQSYMPQIAMDGDFQLLRPFSSVIQNTAERAGQLRSVNGKTPSPSPFPTPLTRELAFNFLNQQRIVPGSCPDSDTVDLPIFGVLNIVQSPLVCNKVDQLVEFSIQSTSLMSLSGSYVAYINQNNQPVVVPIVNPKIQDGCVNFYAVFPCSLTTFGVGLTVVSVVSRIGPYVDIEDLTDFVQYGPALINLS